MLNIDADLFNADWIKVMRWDLPTDKAAFLDAIGGPGALEHFLSLPASDAMPERLKADLGLVAQPGGREPAAQPDVASLKRAKYSEDQPRDHGRFAEVEGAPEGTDKPSDGPKGATLGPYPTLYKGGTYEGAPVPGHGGETGAGIYMTDSRPIAEGMSSTVREFTLDAGTPLLDFATSAGDVKEALLDGVAKSNLSDTEKSLTERAINSVDDAKTAGDVWQAIQYGHFANIDPNPVLAAAGFGGIRYAASAGGSAPWFSGAGGNTYVLFANENLTESLVASPTKRLQRYHVKYSEDQPRDHGRFAEVEGASEGSDKPSDGPKGATLGPYPTLYKGGTYEGAPVPGHGGETGAGIYMTDSRPIAEGMSSTVREFTLDAGTPLLDFATSAGDVKEALLDGVAKSNLSDTEKSLTERAINSVDDAKTAGDVWQAIQYGHFANIDPNPVLAAAGFGGIRYGASAGGSAPWFSGAGGNTYVLFANENLTESVASMTKRHPLADDQRDSRP